MTRTLSESRSFRTNLSTYLTSTAGWAGLNFSEGWDTIDIENPLVNVYVLDGIKDTLELGDIGTHKLFERIIQIDCYMESENRVRALCEDVMDYLDAVSLTINDVQTTSGIGYAVFPNSEMITATFIPPEFNDPEVLRWRGVVRGKYEAYYPNGGSPF